MGNTVVVDRIKKCWSYQSAKTNEQVLACNLDMKDLESGSMANVTLKVNASDPRFPMQQFTDKKCDPKKDSKCVLRLNDFF